MLTYELHRLDCRQPKENNRVINLHNHSTWSDGKYPPDQLVEIGLQSGLTHIGLSDHFFTKKMFLHRTFVDSDQLDDYITDLHRTAEQFAGQINVLAGIEVDWSARARPKLAALWDQIDRLDYILFEYVEDLEWHGDSLESLLTIRPRISIPVGLAHNHLSKNFGPHYTVAELIHALEEYDIFVELSTNPFTTYYTSTDPYNIRLWQAFANSNVRFSIGSDTHGFATDIARVKSAHEFLEKRGLLRQLITEWWDPSQRSWTERAGHKPVIKVDRPTRIDYPRT